MTGEYVPLRMATDDQIADLFAGRLRSNLNTGTTLEVVMTYETNDREIVLSTDIIKVRYRWWDGTEKEWTPDPYRAGFLT